jgi:hypothetical protein
MLFWNLLDDGQNGRNIQQMTNAQSSERYVNSDNRYWHRETIIVVIIIIIIIIIVQAEPGAHPAFYTRCTESFSG